MRRRMFLAAAAAGLFAGVVRAAPLPAVTVWKSPTCGCCSAWLRHMRAAGFQLSAIDVGPEQLNAFKRMAGLPESLWSCHTARVGRYVIEGHVPAADVHRLLAEAPEALGLTVPGMPVGAPGMELDGRRDPFATLLILKDGSTRLFAQHG